MRCAVDLHIHSCLSPCGDEWMTPNNIVNMAVLKGLDMIAVADHNSAANLPAVSAVAQAAGLALLPAMELNTAEEVHLLTYFPTVQQAIACSDAVYAYLPEIENAPAIFGRQQVMDADDEPVREEKKLLISALTLGLDELTEMVRSFGGAAVPAHINRSSNGILGALGFIPPGADFAALEISIGLPLPHKGLPQMKHLHSSDAHYLQDIFERVEYIDLPEKSADGFFEWLSV